MDSRNITFVIRMGLVGIVLAFSAACSERGPSDPQSEYIVGNPLQGISSLLTESGEESQQVVIFDKALRRIHQFDLDSMKAIRSFGVRSPEKEHFVLSGKNGNYIIDISLQSLTIYNRFNQAHHQPLKMQGVPKSAYFDPNAGIFLLYDDLQSVGLMSLDTNGEVLKKTLLGASVLANSAATITAGDVDSTGQLIVALTNNRIAVIDTIATLNGSGVNSKGWHIKNDFAVALTDISWIAPLPLASPSANRLILARSNTKIALIDTVTGAVLSSYDVTGKVEKLSKQVDPHVVLRDDNYVTVIYAKNGVLETIPLVSPRLSGQIKYIMSSTLNLAEDSWSFVDSTEDVGTIFNNLDAQKKSRRFKRYQLTRALATHNVALANEPQIAMANSFVFALFPDELGYAERIHVSTEEKRTIERFNLRYIPAN